MLGLVVFTDFWLQPWYTKLLEIWALLLFISEVRSHLLCKVYKAYRTPRRADNLLGFRFLYETINEGKKGNFQEFIRLKMNRMNLRTASFKLAGKDIIITHDPENIKAILATQFNDFVLGSRRKSFHITLGDGIFTLDGAGWKHSRALLRPQFSKEQVSQLHSLQRSVNVLIDLISQKKGKTFDIQPLFYQLTVDNGTDFLFGESCNSLSDASFNRHPREGEIDMGIKKDFPEAFDHAQNMLHLRLNLQNFYWLGYSKKFEESNRIVHEFTNFYVNKALSLSKDELESSFGGSYVFLNELVKETRNPTILRDQCLNILLAARDTTAGLLSFTFYLLARNPQIFYKLRKHIIETFGEGENADMSLINFLSLKKCEYLKWVLNEVLRLYPSVPRNLRVAHKNTTLPRGGGPEKTSPIFIEKGTPIFYAVYSLHRDELYYGEDAHIFRPERWEEPSARQIGWAYLPFNGGPRICLGQQFALTTASYVTVRLLQTFQEINSFDADAVPRLKKHLTMSLMDGANISLV